MSELAGEPRPAVPRLRAELVVNAGDRAMSRVHERVLREGEDPLTD